MIKFENTETYGWEAAIRGMRNPLNSWAKSDSEIVREYDGKPARYNVGQNDINLMKRLRNAGTDHRKFMRMITVTTDITAPLYWWKEFDTYKVGTVRNSCSTMHKIQANKFTILDFSWEHLCKDARSDLGHIIYKLNLWRDAYNAADMEARCRLLTNHGWHDTYIPTKEDCWWQLIQLLPSSYNQRATVMMSYEVLANMAKKGSRRDHKLDEWRVGFMDWIKTLPYSELILGEVEE